MVNFVQLAQPRAIEMVDAIQLTLPEAIFMIVLGILLVTWRVQDDNRKEKMK